MSDDAQRDSYRVDLKCPTCGLQGAATVSEEDYPFTEDRRFSVDDVTTGFSVQNTGSIVSEMEITCSECNVSARPTEPVTPTTFEATAPRALQPDETLLDVKPLSYFRRR